MSTLRASPWSTPEDVVASVQRLWDSGSMLAARLEDSQLFPREIRLRQPGVAEMAAQFDAVRAWIAALVAASRSAQAHGYDLVWRDINHRQLGRNRVPVAVVIPSEADALHLIGRAAQARHFDRLCAATLDAFPALRGWVTAHPLELLEHADDWPRILAVLRWFVAHPRPNIYLRQLDIEDVDTKFIETRKALLATLLDRVLPASAISAQASGPRQFEARYGLLAKEPLLRFRILDPAYAIGALSDLSVPLTQFAALSPRVERIFVTENDINALAFPALRSSMVIFGGGYGVDRLAQVPWLQGRDVHYWGDIDTHGFAILDRLRACLPQVRSLLMDDATLHAHRRLWGQEDADKCCAADLTRLTAAERELYEQLRRGTHGERVRLEQERLRYGWVVAALRELN